MDKDTSNNVEGFNREEILDDISIEEDIARIEEICRELSRL